MKKPATTGSGFKNNLKNFTGANGRRMFVQMCIIAGCDYLESIHGVGLIGAQQAVLRNKNSDNDCRLADIVNQFRSMGKTIPNGYLERAERVEALFHYQPVYNPTLKAIHAFMSPPTELSLSNALFTGAWQSPRVEGAILRSLGSGEDLIKCFPEDMTIEDMGDGSRSCKDYEFIVPSFPWESGCYSAPPGPLTHLWSMRRNMIQFLQTNSTGKQSQNQVLNMTSKSASMRYSSSSSSSYKSSGVSSGAGLQASNSIRKNAFMQINGERRQRPSPDAFDLRSSIPSFTVPQPPQPPHAPMACVASDVRDILRDIMHPPESGVSSSLSLSIPAVAAALGKVACPFS